MVRQFFSLSPYSTEQFFVSVQASSVYYWAAREGNAQPNNVGRLVCAGKRQNGGRNSQKALRKPFPFSGADFFRGGDGSFQVVWRTDLEVDLNEHKIISRSFWPYVYAE